MYKTENQNVEFKEQWRDEILKTVCAFANTGGGVNKYQNSTGKN